MPVRKSQIKATSKYEKQNYFKTLVRFPKDLEQDIRDRAAEENKSLNSYISDLVKDDLKTK